MASPQSGFSANPALTHTRTTQMWNFSYSYLACQVLMLRLAWVSPQQLHMLTAAAGSDPKAKYAANTSKHKICMWAKAREKRRLRDLQLNVRAIKRFPVTIPSSAGGARSGATINFVIAFETNTTGHETRQTEAAFGQRLPSGLLHVANIAVAQPPSPHTRATFEILTCQHSVATLIFQFQCIFDRQPMPHSIRSSPNHCPGSASGLLTLIVSQRFHYATGNI